MAHDEAGEFGGAAGVPAVFEEDTSCIVFGRWVHLNTHKKRQHNALFALNRYLQSWIDQLLSQRLKPMDKLGWMLLNHLDGILNYCRIKVPLGVGKQ